MTTRRGTGERSSEVAARGGKDHDRTDPANRAAHTAAAPAAAARGRPRRPARVYAHPARRAWIGRTRARRPPPSWPSRSSRPARPVVGRRGPRDRPLLGDGGCSPSSATRTRAVVELATTCTRTSGAAAGDRARAHVGEVAVTTLALPEVVASSSPATPRAPRPDQGRARPARADPRLREDLLCTRASRCRGRRMPIDCSPRSSPAPPSARRMRGASREDFATRPTPSAATSTRHPADQPRQVSSVERPSSASSAWPQARRGHRPPAPRSSAPRRDVREGPALHRRVHEAREHRRRRPRRLQPRPAPPRREAIQQISQRLEGLDDAQLDRLARDAGATACAG
jgi:hypothetical protein